MKNNFYIFVIIILFVVFIYLFTNKEGLIFSRKVNIDSILYNSALDNTTKMNLIEQTDVVDSVYSNIINKQTYCTGVSPYPSTTSNNGADCADARVAELKRLYEMPDMAYDVNRTIYAVSQDKTLNNDTKIALLKNVPTNDVSSDPLIQIVKGRLDYYDDCMTSDSVVKSTCPVNAISSIQNTYSRV